MEIDERYIKYLATARTNAKKELDLIRAECDLEKERNNFFPITERRIYMDFLISVMEKTEELWKELDHSLIKTKYQGFFKNW